MELADLDFRELNSFIDLSSFDCNDSDLNGFLKSDSLDYQKQLISKTYLFTTTEEIVSFFSISNDNLMDKGYENSIWNKLHRKTNIPNAKRIRQYPAIKIGRLGVSSSYQKKGLGRQMLDFIKNLTLKESKSACRFILVDAYNKPEVLNFYANNDFTLLLEDDTNEKTRIMYFDLIRLT